MPTTRTETVTAPDGGTYDAHLTIPDGGTGPGVLLLQEIFGVNDFLKAKAADLAELGYVVMCPDVFWRVEPGVALPHDEVSLGQAFGYMEKYMGVDDSVKIGDLGAALAHLRVLPEVTGKVGVMGYCLGGFLTYALAATQGPDAAVSYYGSGISDRLPMGEAISCPIVFQYGGNDPFIPMDQINAVRDALGDRPNVTIHVHEGAGHAFENFLAPQFHDEAASKASWPITVEFLETHLQP